MIADDLKSALRELLTDPERLRRMGNIGRAKVVDKFSVETMAQRYRLVYNDLI